MTIEVETKDCSMLGDAELEEMTELCAEGPNSFGIGLISVSYTHLTLPTIYSV